ncbi:MAG: gamma-butyrobetaine hydroxylase-like domain-containing protein [Ilumatobacteraceae bacterium]
MSDLARETPADIDIVRDRAVTVTFEDGEVCEFPVDSLRAVCPCAACRGIRERGGEAWPVPGGSTTVSVRHAELNGAWGLSIEWSDGHATGIYAWSVLRRWWDAGLAGGLVVDPGHHQDPAG